MRPSLLLLVAGALCLSCLPVDTRAPPATVLVTVRGLSHIKDGIPAAAMDDGWAITFDKFLVGLGQAELSGDPCTPYSDADYRRIFDGREVAPQKASILYALGTCAFAARAGWPDPDSPRGAGATEADLTFMLTPGADRFAGVNAGMTIYVAGRARKDTATKTFAWAFRGRRVAITDCSTERGNPDSVKLVLQGNTAQTVDLTLRGDVLFQDHIDATKARHRFGPMAAADDAFGGDKDGVVTLDELDAMTLDDAGITTPEQETVGDAAVPEWKTFADFVYLGLFPEVFGLGETGICHTSIRLQRPPG